MKDNNGNTITIRSGAIKLHLLGKRPRLIGQIDDNKETLFVKRKRGLHLMRANNSYGFNHYVLSNAKRFNRIHLKDEYGDYMVPVKTILDSGTFLHFNKQGFERQIFLNINYLDQFKVGNKATSI